MKLHQRIRTTIVSIFLLIIANNHAYAETGNSVIYIAGWDVYADPGNRNKTIGYQSFEEKTGYKIHFTPLTNLDQILHHAESSKDVDALIISNEGIKILKDMDLVDDLDIEAVTNYTDLHHSLQYSEWSQFNGKIYAVPWAWGPTGLLYDSENVPEPESWNVLWDIRYRSKVSLWDDVSMIWIAALSLGYENVYNLTVSQLDEVKEKLMELNNQVYAYYSGEQEELELLKSGKVLIANSWFDPSSRLSRYGKNFKMVIPLEGAVGMFDSYMIKKDSGKKEILHEYINHQISPETQLKMSRITGLAPSNIETLSLMPQEEIKSLHLDDPNHFRRMILWDIMPRKHLYEKLLREVREDEKG